jgi:hypothetical protein
MPCRKARHVADDEIALEVALEQHDESIRARAISEIVDEQVEPHPRRHPEHRRKAEADRRRMPIQQDAFDLDLVSAVERHRADRRLLGAELAGFPTP